ncbi:MAG: phosphatidylglycerol lysyltransferase domain-containing protein [Desulfurivibrionaceae bacterium]|nr:phosphatidylglycerol lysyltransferase domain-containing protein [Desulfobulbales bacterium]MDT8334452.1 phosphatidylglycerol lysyltransferase domain-containing protein [Desulfurivibrionaceae bacterium]
MNEPCLLDLSKAALVNRYLAAYPPVISEHTFTNLFAWRETKPIHLYETANTLIFLAKTGICRNDELMIMGPPAGKLNLAEVFRELGDRVIGGIRLTGTAVEGVANGSYLINPDPDNSDYVYLVRDLAELKGRAYAKKRSQARQCRKHYDCIFEPITTDNLDECENLLARWCHSRDCAGDPGLHGESRAIRTTLDHFTDFNLLGGAVRVDGTIEAFSIGERLNRDTAVCHFEKAMPEINGLNQLVNQWFAKYCLTGFKYINREQDLGIPGLRQAKESYHPDHLVEKFEVLRDSVAERANIKPIRNI